MLKLLRFGIHGYMGISWHSEKINCVGNLAQNMPHENITAYPSNYSLMLDPNPHSLGTPTACRNNRSATAFVGGLRLIIILLIVVLSSARQMAIASHGKFVGNIPRSSITVDPVLGTYWNQAFPENSVKWTRLVATRDVMNWTHFDFVFANNYYRDRGIPFKPHSLVWAYDILPEWTPCLTTNSVRKSRNSSSPSPPATRVSGVLIVVNQPLTGHMPILHKNAIGGS